MTKKIRFKGNWPAKKLVFHTYFFLNKCTKIFEFVLNKPEYFKKEFDNPYIFKVILFYRNHKEDKHKKLLSNKQVNNNFTKPQKFARESIGHKILKLNTNIFKH